MLAAGVGCGGWCPAGRLAEDGRIPDRYPLAELPDGEYAQRTERNVADPDATLIIAFGEPQGGTRATIDFCIQHQKPYLVLGGSCTPLAKAESIARAFVNEHAVQTLNVAGPRASEWTGAYEFALHLISVLLRTPDDLPARGPQEQGRACGRS